MSDSVRRRMLKERIVPKAEEYWYMTDHPHLRAAAAELFLNLLFCEEFFKQIVRVHFFLFCVQFFFNFQLASQKKKSFDSFASERPFSLETNEQAPALLFDSGM